MVVPNGVLFGDGVAARIKEELLKEFNLHTIVRLPNGVFAPYTSIPTNLLFFDRTGPTKHIWYYDQPLPEGRKTYTKTQPIRFEEFEGCLQWWKEREENERAWKVASLINNFGEKALLVLSGYGVGVDTAARILRNYVDDENVFKSIYNAERQYVTTRAFWKD